MYKITPPNGENGHGDLPWSRVGLGREEALPSHGFGRFLVCGQIPVGEPRGSWSLVCAIQAESHGLN